MTNSIETTSITDKGLNPKYTVNEDSYLIMEEEQVFAVADGVGGAHAGDMASRTALAIIHQGVKKFFKHYHGNKIDFLKKLIQAGNRIVHRMSAEQNKQMASTIAIMAVEGNEAILGHVGDSRIYIARNGNILQLTRDHSKLQQLLEQNPRSSITRSHYHERHVITKALGVERNVEADIQKVILRHDDVFVLCTDGIYIHNTDEELRDIINGNRNDLKFVCEKLKTNCYDRGAKDNLTAVVVRVGLSVDRLQVSGGKEE